MTPEARQTLLALNRAFYERFGPAYAEKRPALHPGMARVLTRIPLQGHVLDVGCGHGRVLEALIQKGFQGRYTGVDASATLLHQAWERSRKAAFTVVLLQRDITQPHWADDLPPADVVLSFSVLHHIPGRALQRRVLQTLREGLRPSGWLGLSVWNLVRSPRLKARIQPWARIGLTARAVDAGDMLLDWRHGGEGLRYIHQFTLPELEALARDAGFCLQEAFLEDGENRRLGLYTLWRPC